MEMCDDYTLHGDATFQTDICSFCGEFGRDGKLWCRWVRL